MMTDTALAYFKCDKVEQKSLLEERSGKDGTKPNSNITGWLCMGCGVRMQWYEFERHFYEVHVKQNKLNMLCPVHYSKLVNVKSLHQHNSCFREEASRDETSSCRMCNYKARRLGELVGHMLYMHKCYNCGCCGASLSGGIVSLKMHQDSCHSNFNIVLLMYKSVVYEFLNQLSSTVHSTANDESEPVIVDLTVDDGDSSENSTTVNQSGGTAVGGATTSARLPNVDAMVTSVTSNSNTGSWNNRAWSSDRATVAPVKHNDTPRSPADTPVDVTVDGNNSGVQNSSGRFQTDQNVPLKKITIYRCTICLKQYDTKKAACTHLGTVHLRRKILGDLIEAQDHYIARSTRRSDRRRFNQIADDVPSTSGYSSRHDM
ncbi:hypothetical protein T10_6725 [Trichinella papuae]|uniref:C2H2-type domain-containing protein n=1 Tax=Trichinella papuae TaxID=268474 RepID=A0A0V1MW82_9BILA|nr:hypothetical protein T10_6725 [Trichinella papuae]